MISSGSIVWEEKGKTVKNKGEGITLPPLFLHHESVDKYKFVVYNISMEEKKFFIDAVLEREKQRNLNMRRAYAKRIAELPRGSLVIRKLNGREYCYLRYRDGGKTVQRYAGTVEQATLIREKIAERKHLMELSHMLEEENRRIERMEAIK